jgi:hypothetical protein
MTRTPLLLLASVALATGCTPIALSPPSQFVPLHTVETARVGHVTLRGSGGGQDYGREIASGSGGVSVGVAPDVEVQVDGTGAFIGGMEGRAVTPVIGVARVGVQQRVEDWLAFSGGIGAGAGPWGAFTAGDLGVIFAYENPYFVPFFAARMQLSIPVNPAAETITQMSGGMTSMFQLAPSTTMWLQPSTGFRIPFCRDAGCDGVRVSLVVAASWTHALTIDTGFSWSAIGAEGGLVVEL